MNVRNCLQEGANGYESQVDEGLQKTYIWVACFTTDLTLRVFVLFWFGLFAELVKHLPLCSSSEVICQILVWCKPAIANLVPLGKEFESVSKLIETNKTSQRITLFFFFFDWWFWTFDSDSENYESGSKTDSH